jgi:hypothetical protein
MIARLVVFAFSLHTAMEVNVVLPAVTGLVGVGESGVKFGRSDLDFALCHFYKPL